MNSIKMAANMSASEACTSAAVPASATVLCSWPVEKYARFVPSLHPLPTGERETKKANSAGSWQVRARLTVLIASAMQLYEYYGTTYMHWTEVT